MPQLVYTTIMSLDGYIEDPDGSFDWAAPDHEVHAFVNDLERPIGTYLYGRRTYETMTIWQRIGTAEAPTGPEPPAAEELDYAEIWRAADKIVYSRTLDGVSTPRTTLERDFDTAAVRRLKDAVDRDLSVSGPTLAQHAFAAGLVDEVHVLVVPVLVGGGKPGLPRDERLELELLDTHRFRSGVVHLHYRVASTTAPRAGTSTTG